MEATPLGYAWLIRHFGLVVLAPTTLSFLLRRGHRQSQRVDGCRQEYYPPRQDPGEAWTDHLLFALKNEGVNLEVLAALFRVAPTEELSAWIKAAPMGRYGRIAWFLYEWLLDCELPLPDLIQGNYIPLLDPEQYYTLPYDNGAIRTKRQRVVNNLAGSRNYAPQIRRTDELRRFEELHLDRNAAELVASYPADLLYRASSYLYAKETKSSYAIEHLTTDARRTARFVDLLKQAGRLDCFKKEVLIKLQNIIVDDRYAANDVRNFQNYVGESLSPTHELVHYIPPQPHDLDALMEGWMETCRLLQQGNVHPVVTAAVAGFGFVFLHPFEDGNGRLHRFLLHHALAVGKFNPPGMIFPVSATMLKQMSRYDAALETYSREIAKHVLYRLNEQGSMQVMNETVPFYRYPDLTQQTEALFGFIEDTIEKELRTELEYLEAFDTARRKMRDVVDMPDRRLDLFLRICMQGKGDLSKTKRRLFPELSDDECRKMEEIVREALK